MKALALALLGTMFELIHPPLGYSQAGSRDIQAREKELRKLQREIDQYESKIRKSEQREKSALETLDYYDRQGLLIRRLLRTLKEQSTQLQKDIDELRRGIRSSENQLGSLRDEYAAYVASVYKYSRLQDLELLLTSKSLNQLAIRAEYLRRFTDQRKNEISSISRSKSQLERQSKTLQAKLLAQEKLITQKAAEERRIKNKTAEQQKLLASIRRNMDSYRKELQRKSSAVTQLEKMMADLIERERIRKAHDAEAAKKEDRRLPEVSSAGFGIATRRGRLPWPVDGGTIAARYGNQIHPVLKTVTHNTGIDISVPPGSNVRSVAAGEVAIISWLPSYGNLVIINHNYGYRTVYTHLSEILVVQGQKVGEGDLIGKSGESLSGPVLHFELWKEREKQDPELWLSKR